MEGWIKLHRKFIDWEWFDDHNVLVLFLYLLLSANHRQAKWQSVQLRIGQLVTSYATVKRHTRLSLRSIRTAFTKLKSTGEVTVKTTNKYSIVTINNYNTYQQTTDQSTVKRHTSDTQATTNKNDKNDKNIISDEKLKKIREEIYNKLGKPL